VCVYGFVCKPQKNDEMCSARVRVYANTYDNNAIRELIVCYQWRYHRYGV